MYRDEHNDRDKTLLGSVMINGDTTIEEIQESIQEVTKHKGCLSVHVRAAAPMHGSRTRPPYTAPIHGMKAFLDSARKHESGVRLSTALDAGIRPTRGFRHEEVQHPHSSTTAELHSRQ